MKILYIIKSCDSFYDNRVFYQKKTWLKKLNSLSDYIVITSSLVGEDTYNCFCEDGYFSTAEKIKNYIKNNNFDDYDWYFLIDDDVFVFPERLENYINNNKFESNSSVVIGNLNCFFREMNEDIFCGGAGIILSKKTINLIKEQIIKDDTQCGYACDDCFLFCLSNKLNLTIVNNSPGNSSNGVFIPTYYKESSELIEKIDRCVILHQIKTEQDYKELFEKFYE